MPVQLRYKERSLRLFKCARGPDLETRTILVDDQWDYVEMWLKRNNKSKALFFWRQAEDFARASEDLPNTSSPLTKYYCAMNAAKALLEAKGVQYSPYHGITGKNTTGVANLESEMVTLVDNNAIAPQLCRFMGETVSRVTYTMKDLLFVSGRFKRGQS